MQVELVYENTCPNVAAARGQLLQAFAQSDIAPDWREWEVSASDAPDHIHGYGSPTILVDGKDVSGEMTEGHDYCCRVYAHDEMSNKGVPAVKDIMHALKAGRRDTAPPTKSARWKLNGAVMPAFGTALLPKLTCPACWPAYAGLLSSFGVGFFDYTPYLLPLTGMFVLIALAALGFRARQRRGFRPLLLGATGAAVLLIGKFAYDSDVAMYAGLAVLVAASLWNSWPMKQFKGKDCPACSG